jgi:hypothetical protein
MKKIMILLVFIFAILNLSAVAKQALFIGNSITYMGDIPQKFETIADAFGDSVDVTLHTPGGTGIGDHVVSEILYEKIRQGIWDYFIIQPGSGESPGTSTPPEITLERIETILDSVYHYNPYVQPLFYQISSRTWGHSPEELENYNQTMDLILENVQYWADNTETFLAPVGETLRAAWNQDQETLFWYDFNDIHLNERGSYLAACVFYATIFQKPSSGTEYLGDLELQTAAEYQSMADEMTLNNFPDWRINSYNFWLDFEVEQNMNEISIINNSSNLESVFWDFGDGITSEDFAPEHHYQQVGTYQICLQAEVIYNSGLAAVISDSLLVEVTDLIVSSEEQCLDERQISIFPNPFSPLANQQLKICFGLPESALKKVEIYNAKGQKISNMKWVEPHQYFWDGRDSSGKNVSSGIYLIRAETTRENLTGKILVLP